MPYISLASPPEAAVPAPLSDIPEITLGADLVVIGSGPPSLPDTSDGGMATTARQAGTSSDAGNGDTA